MADAPVYYRSAAKFSKWTVGLLWGHFPVQAITIGLTYARFGKLEWDDAELVALGATGICSILLTLATTVAFCMWFYRVNLNLRALGVAGLSRTAGWAVGSFFVPFVNLIVPYWAAQEVWRSTEPGVDVRSKRSWDGIETPWTLGLWWAAWVAARIVNWVASQLTRLAKTNEQMEGADTLSIIGSVLSLLAACFAVWMVRSLTARQDAKAVELFGPPPAA